MEIINAYNEAVPKLNEQSKKEWNQNIKHLSISLTVLGLIFAFALGDKVKFETLVYIAMAGAAILLWSYKNTTQYNSTLKTHIYC